MSRSGYTDDFDDDDYLELADDGEPIGVTLFEPDGFWGAQVPVPLYLHPSPSAREAGVTRDAAWQAWQAATALQTAKIADLERDAERWSALMESIRSSAEKHQFGVPRVCLRSYDGYHALLTAGEATEVIDRARSASSSAEGA